MSILEGAIIGGVIGIVTALVINGTKRSRYKTLTTAIKDPNISYQGFYHYATAKRYRRSFKFFDSYGILYIIGKMAYYKTTVSSQPMVFDLSACTVQQEPDWRWVKWFSITTPNGEKHYFNSHKMGAIKNDSGETLEGLKALQSAKAV